MYLLTSLALRADPNSSTNTTRNTIVLTPISARMALVFRVGVYSVCLWIGRFVVPCWRLLASSSFSAVGGFRQMVV